MYVRLWVEGTKKRDCDSVIGKGRMKRRKLRNIMNVTPIDNARIPRTAMVLAAGLGKRMRPLTENCPKPLIKVRGKTLLDHALDALEMAGVEKTVVNVHYLAEQVCDHLEKRAKSGMEIIVSDERDQLLDSGGGIKKALPHLGANPFYLLNADSFWIEGYRPNLLRLAEAWNGNEGDIVLLLSGMASAIGFGSKGDFLMDGEGRLERRGERRVAPFAYAGGAILHPAIFHDAPDEPFSLNRQFDAALEQRRLFGLRLEGLWLHVGTPAAIDEAEEAIERSAA